MQSSNTVSSNLPLTIETINSIPIHFIIGTARSGTTLLQTMFAMHPNICAPIESRFIIHLHKKYAQVKKWSDAKIDAFVDDLCSEFFFIHFWQISKEHLIGKIKEINKEDISFSILCKLVFIQYQNIYWDEKEIKVFIDKHPPFILFIKELITLFPTAKFIHIVRDYRDNILSRRKLFIRKNINLLTEEWLIENKNVDKYKDEYPSKFFTIRYEDLVQSPEQNMMKLADFMGLQYNSRVLQHYVNVNKVKDQHPEEFEFLQQELLKPINSDNISKWKGNFSQNEMSYMYYRIGKYADKYDYKQTNTNDSNKYVYEKFRAYFTYQINRRVIRLYYNILPMWFRKIMSRVSKKLYKWFKYSNYYNHYDHNKIVQKTQ